MESGHPNPALTTLLLILLAVLPGTHTQADSCGPVRVAGVTYLGDLPTLVARQESLFAEHGLGVEVVFNESGKHNLDELRAGRTDFALMALTPLVIDQLNDATPGEADDPVIVANLVHATSLNDVVALVGPDDSPPADLAGKRVGLAAGTNSEFAWWLFAQYRGFDPHAATVVHVPVGSLQAALESGRIDVAVVWQPWSAQLRQHFGDRLRSLEGGDIYIAKWVLVTTRQNVETRPDCVATLISAYRDAVDFIERNPDHTIEVYARETGLPVAILQEIWAETDYDLNLDWSLIAAYQQQAGWARRAGYGTAGGDAHVFTLIEPRPLATVFPSAVSIPLIGTSEQAPP